MKVCGTYRARNSQVPPLATIGRSATTARSRRPATADTAPERRPCYRHRITRALSPAAPPDCPSHSWLYSCRRHCSPRDRSIRRRTPAQPALRNYTILDALLFCLRFYEENTTIFTFQSFPSRSQQQLFPVAIPYRLTYKFLFFF